MASDLFVFGDSYFSDPFYPFSDASIDPQHDFLQTFEDNLNSNNNNNNNNSTTIQENSVDETTNSFEQIASALFSSSPPSASDQLENLSICQTAHNFPNENNSDYSPLDVIKTEEYHLPIENITGINDSFVPQNNTAENVIKQMQRSYSSNSFDGKPNFLFRPRFDSLMEYPNLQYQVINPPEINFSSGQMRRACSTGDLQVNKNTTDKNILSSSPVSAEGSFVEEANLKVGRYSAEERKERIHRYRAKRTQRNFSKTIKYACRKTLADNRLRIRGRFVRNDEAVEIPKASMFNIYEEDDLWIEGCHEEDDEGSSVGRSSGTFYNNFGSAQYQYYSY